MSCSYNEPNSNDNHRSGIYLWGYITHWKKDTKWEFVECGNNRYVLYDKLIYRTFNIDMRRAKHEVDFMLFGGNGTEELISLGKPYQLGRDYRYYVDCGYEPLQCDSIVLLIDGREATITFFGNRKPLQLLGDTEGKQILDTTPKTTNDKSDILILGNSLSTYNHLNELIERTAWENGLNVKCTGMNKGGASLQELWEIDTCAYGGTLSPRATVSSRRWTHIILQDYSLMPLYYPQKSATEVDRWVKYIRSHCPNQNVQIILAVNWPECNYWDSYAKLASNIMHNTSCIALNNGISLCPWGGLYAQTSNQYGIDATKKLYLDEIHPTPIASQLMAIMLLAIITGEKPSHFNWNSASCDHKTALSFLQTADNVLNVCDSTLLPMPTLKPYPRIQSQSMPWHIIHSHWKPLYQF